MTIKDTMMPVISSYHGAAAPTTFGQTSPGSRPYQQSNSPGPSGQEVYSQSPEQSYVQATSPQPSGFQALAINRVSSNFNFPCLKVICTSKNKDKTETAAAVIAGMLVVPLLLQCAY